MLQSISSKGSIKFNENYLVKLTKNDNSFNKETRKNCKVLQFLPGFDIDEVLAKIGDLDPQESPNLFIFIISNKISFDKKMKEIVTKFKESLCKFFPNRPFVLQLESKEESFLEIHYKEETFDKFFKTFHDWLAFLRCFLQDCGRKFENTELNMLEKLSFTQNTSLILRFLRTLNIEEEFYELIILKVAKCGTKDNLLAALDASFEDDGRILNSVAESNLSWVFYGYESEIKSCQSAASSKIQLTNEQVNYDSASEISSNSNSESIKYDASYEMFPLSSEGLSVLYTAIEYSNQQIIEYLIAYCTPLIQQLPLNHQTKISTIAFATNQFDVLCDLLEISDFPFSENFKVGDNLIHEKFCQVIDIRMKFKAAIEDESISKIEELMDGNLSLKIFYNPENKSAMKQALDLKKFNVYFYLKSHGFHATEFKSLEDVLSEEELKKAFKCGREQRLRNVNEALSDYLNSVMLLCTRSFIHNRKISKKMESEYRGKIRKWYEDICEISPEIINVAATSENLKIVFDFESILVDRVALLDNALGVTFDIKTSNIFIGAKLSNEKREQEIKGVIAHELCHYVMMLVYENKFLPYYKHAIDVRDIFEQIASSIDIWSLEESKNEDDECDGIISSVFRDYQPGNFHLELIVRVVQISVNFYENQKKLRHIQEKYKIIFNFWEHHVLPELQNFSLKNRKIVRKMNEIAEILPNILNQDIKFSASKSIEFMYNSKPVIVTTNNSKLLFINIVIQLQEKFGSLLDSRNFFTQLEKFQNQQILNYFAQICNEIQSLNIYIDCTIYEELPEKLDKIFESKNLNFIFIVENKSQCEEIIKIFTKNDMEEPTRTEINYSWKDLTIQSQTLLLQNKINFQNNFEYSLLDLLQNQIDGKLITHKLEEKQEENVHEDFSDIVDDQLLKLLLEKQQILVNTKFENLCFDKYFELLFQPRKFIKKEGAQKSVDVSTVSKKHLSIEELLCCTKNEKYILISDIAGTGKSWIMKNIANVLLEKFPTRWVTYVDLKQFIKEFRTENDELEFLAFLINQVLKLKNKFEAKVFEHLYNNGKTSILFDGFDEIAPNCAERVSKLSKSFKSNGENQLWIATRDYFEVDLKQTLKINEAYKLHQFTEEDGVDFIARCWMLEDLENTNVIRSKEHFENNLKISPNYKAYQENARQMIKKLSMSNYRSIGMPQLFKMIADSYSSDNKNILMDVNGFKIYRRFALNIYERWSNEKGQLRKQASIESQSDELNFWKFHQFTAIDSLFPELSRIFFPDCDVSNWTDEEIIACGLMNKTRGILLFIHETFREFFVADYISQNLKRKFNDKNFLNFFVEVLVTKKLEVVQMFLNYAIDDFSILEKIRPKMQEFTEKFHNMESFANFFENNLEYLADFVIAILRNGEYEKFKNILISSAYYIVTCTKVTKIFLVFQKLLFEFLKIDDLKYLIAHQGIFQRIIYSGLDVEIFENFVTKIEELTDREFIREQLKLKTWDGNIFLCLCKSFELNACKIHRLFEMMEKYLTGNEIFELMKNCDKNGSSVLHSCSQRGDSEVLKVMWPKIEEINVSRNLIKFIYQTDLDGKTFLHFTANQCFEFHKILWIFMLELFKNREELKNFILQKDRYGNTYIHSLMEQNNNTALFEFVFNIFKEIFSVTQFQEIIKTKGDDGLNLLLVAVIYQESDRDGQSMSQTLWKTSQTIFKSNKEFLTYLKEVDEYGKNILCRAAEVSSGKSFNFMIKELEKIALREDIRELLSCHDIKYNQNLFQTAACMNTSSELHNILWKTFHKYFKQSEILKFIKNVDSKGNSLLFNAVCWNTKEIGELALTKIKSYMTKTEQIEYLKSKGWEDKNLNELSLHNFTDKQAVRVWVNNLLNEYGIEH